MITRIYPEIYLHALINIYKCTDQCVRVNIHVNEIWKLMKKAVVFWEGSVRSGGTTTFEVLCLVPLGTYLSPWRYNGIVRSRENLILRHDMVRLRNLLGTAQNTLMQCIHQFPPSQCMMSEVIVILYSCLLNIRGLHDCWREINVQWHWLTGLTVLPGINIDIE
jgi:hypothetical protein